MSSILSKIRFLRRFLVFYVVWPLCFTLGSIVPVDKNRVIFAYNKNYASMPDNMLPIYEYYKKSGKKCVVYSDEKGALQRLLGDMRFQFLYASSAAVFVTDTFDPLSAHKPRNGTRVIQLWHACGAFKKWGYSTLDLDWGGSRREWELFPKHRNYTDVFVSSPEVADHYAQAFNCSKDIIRPLGAARTDIFFDKSFVCGAAQRLREALPAIGERKIILYAPTFRGTAIADAHNDTLPDLNALRSEFGEKYAFVIRYHPFTLKSGNYPRDEIEACPDFAFLCPPDINMDTAVCAADILISDYSSIIFEYSLLERPMIFYSYDLREYTRQRSYYYDYKTFVPGKIVYDTDGLLEALGSGFDVEKVRSFKEKFMSACDGRCTEKICEFTMSPRTKN